MCLSFCSIKFVVFRQFLFLLLGFLAVASPYEAHADDNVTEQFRMSQAKVLNDFLTAAIVDLGLDPDFRIPGLSDLENVQITPANDFLPRVPAAVGSA